MRFPNKFTTYKDSILSKFPIVLEKLEVQSYTLLALYNSLRRVFDSDIEDFMDTLTCLYALKKIKIDDGVIIYVKND